MISMTKSNDELEETVESLKQQISDLKKIISNLITWVATSNIPPIEKAQAEQLTDLLDE
jgi:hypothetical protein